MTESILKSTKLALGIPIDIENFDVELLMHINTALATVNELGLGPEKGLEIESPDAVWKDLIDTEARINGVKSYVYLRVRLLFDPPQTAHAIAAFEKQIEQLEWRFSVWADELRRERLLPEGGVP